jgi:undecaprenyl-phosphate galactose phosphotransferase
MVCSLFALVILAPFFLIVALLVKITSAGPVFYKTCVVGEGGRRFIWRKFRSMKVIPEQEDNEKRRERFRAYVTGDHQNNSKDVPKKIVDEERITPVGWFIRKFSIDELPQLWNVSGLRQGTGRF